MVQRAFAGEPPAFPILVDADAAFAQYGVNAVPHTLFFDRGGTVQFNVGGYAPSILKDLEKAVKRGL